MRVGLGSVSRFLLIGLLVVSAELLSQEHSESNAQTKCDDKLVGLTKVLTRGWDDETGESCCFEIGLALAPWFMTLSTLFHGVVPAVSN